MTILVCGEGPNDIGRPDRLAETGAVLTLVRRILGDQDWLTFRTVRPVRVHGSRRRTDPPGLKALSLRVVRLAGEAARDGLDGLIVVVDRDGDARKQGWLDQGREAATDGLRIVARVAIETLEAWLMGDPSAFVRLGLREPPGRPEDLPGGGSSARHPKRVLRELLVGLPGSNTERYEQLAGELDLSTVAATCPASFAPFHQPLRTAFPGPTGP